MEKKINLEEQMLLYGVDIKNINPEIIAIVKGTSYFKGEDTTVSTDEETYLILNALDGKFDIALALINGLILSDSSNMMLLNAVAKKMLPDEVLRALLEMSDFSTAEEIVFVTLLVQGLLPEEMGVWYIKEKNLFNNSESVVNSFGSDVLKETLDKVNPQHIAKEPW